MKLSIQTWPEYMNETWYLTYYTETSKLILIGGPSHFSYNICEYDLPENGIFKLTDI